MSQEETIPCETCEQPTTYTGTKRCNACFEVESRLKLYLNRGGDKARAFVLKTVCVTNAIKEET